MQNCSFDECLKKYRALGKSDCFEYVKGDGNCHTWSSMQAFRQASGGEKINFDDPKEFDAMAKLRQEVADRYCEHGTETYEDYKTPGKWANPEYFMQYLSEQNSEMKYCLIDRPYNRETKKLSDKDFTVIFSDFQNMISGCPFVYFVNDNHFINLKPDLETRKKFLPLFYDFYKSYFIYYFLFWRNISRLKWINENNIVWLFLKKLFKDAIMSEINKSMADFFKDVPHKYKPVLTFKLILFIFEKYKYKVLDELNFKVMANEFLSDVLVGFKKEVVDKDPKFSDKKNMQIDVGAILKKFGIYNAKNMIFKIDGAIEYADEIADFLRSGNNDLYNNYADDDIPKDNNCLFWSVLEIIEKRKIDRNVDYNKMLELRKSIGT